MRATRAFVASLGASLSIIVAGSLALLSVSAVVAFQGWPGLASSNATNSAETLAAVDPAAHATRRDGDKRALVVPRRPAVEKVARRAARASQRSTGVATRMPAANANPELQTRPAPTRKAAAETGPPITKPPAATATEAAGDPVRTVGKSLGSTVGEAGKQVNGVVDNVSPALGKVVQDVSQLVAGVLAGTGEVVAGTVDALTRRPK